MSHTDDSQIQLQTLKLTFNVFLFFIQYFGWDVKSRPRVNHFSDAGSLNKTLSTDVRITMVLNVNII